MIYCDDVKYIMGLVWSDTHRCAHASITDIVLCLQDLAGNLHHVLHLGNVSVPEHVAVLAPGPLPDAVSVRVCELLRSSAEVAACLDRTLFPTAECTTDRGLGHYTRDHRASSSPKCMHAGLPGARHHAIPAHHVRSQPHEVGCMHPPQHAHEAHPCRAIPFACSSEAVPLHALCLLLTRATPVYRCRSSSSNGSTSMDPVTPDRSDASDTGCSAPSDAPCSSSDPPSAATSTRSSMSLDVHGFLWRAPPAAPADPGLKAPPPPSALQKPRQQQQQQGGIFWRGLWSREAAKADNEGHPVATEEDEVGISLGDAAELDDDVPSLKGSPTPPPRLLQRHSSSASSSSMDGLSCASVTSSPLANKEQVGEDCMHV